ncbi:Dwarfin sma-2 [Orchesella cincta]|uniref:Dwarfin sma-2 n=1 Tax=Orchesella cincta TaxID=48709 RepID=A0A1D2MYI1_ORCCI|nr:Dwarfin sma-2 [Orchesella cincta]
MGKGDHLQEVLDKWEQIDDEIWAKVIVFERNRRVAKAYARAPVLTVNGSDEGFDGFRIGLNGFENPMRDSKTEDILRHIGHGIKIKMDDAGNILIKRVSKNPVYVKACAEENAISNDVSKLSNGALEMDKPLKLFDMKKFASNVSRELRRAYPDRRKLEIECVTAVSFVKQENQLLDCPCWIMILNLVAMDMLKARIPPVRSPQPNGTMSPTGERMAVANGVPLPAPIPVMNGATDIRNRPKIPLPRDDDDDPYSMLVGQKGGRGGDKPPKLPPRDLNIPKPDYDESIMEEQEPRIKPFFNSSRNTKEQIKSQSKDRKYDDPYYCGLRARIPAFVQRALPQRNKGEAAEKRERELAARNGHGIPNGHVILPNGHHMPMHPGQRYGPPVPGHPMMWHAKSVDSGMASIHSNPYADPQSIRKPNGAPDKYSWNHTFESESDLSESIYAPIYGRLPLPMRNPNTFAPQPSRVAYVGDWE